MNGLQGIMKSVNILNCLLIIATAATAYHVIVPFLNPEIRTTLPVIRETATDTSIEAGPGAIPSFADYSMVSEMNLFHPERRIPAEEKETVEKRDDIPKPDLVLYGTLLSDDLSIAYVEDRKSPYSTPGRGKRQIPLKKGESIGGYVLREIKPDRIVLTMGEEKLVVMLNEEDKKREGEATAPSRPPSRGAVPPAVKPVIPRVATPPAPIPRTMIPSPAVATPPTRSRGAAPATSPRPIRRKSR